MLGCSAMATPGNLGLPFGAASLIYTKGPSCLHHVSHTEAEFGLSRGARRTRSPSHLAASHFAIRDRFPDSWQDSKSRDSAPKGICSPAWWVVAEQEARSNHNHGRQERPPTGHRHWTRGPSVRPAHGLGVAAELQHDAEASPCGGSAPPPGRGQSNRPMQPTMLQWTLEPQKSQREHLTGIFPSVWRSSWFFCFFVFLKNEVGLSRLRESTAPKMPTCHRAGPDSIPKAGQSNEQNSPRILFVVGLGTRADSAALRASP